MMSCRVATVLAFLIGCSGRSVLAPSDDADTDAVVRPDVPINPCPVQTQVDCAGICYELSNNPHHCGACNHACTAPHLTCSAGTCR